MNLALGRTRADRAPRHEIGEILRRDRIEEFTSRGQPEIVDLQQQTASYAQAIVDCETTVEMRIVDEALPPDGRTRLLEVYAHHDFERVAMAFALRDETARVFESGGRIVDRTRPDDDDEPIVSTMENLVRRAPGICHDLGGTFGTWQCVEKLARRREFFNLGNAQVVGLGEGHNGRKVPDGDVQTPSLHGRRPGNRIHSHMPDLTRALITWDCPPPLLEPLEALGVTVEHTSRQDSETEMRAALGDKVALLCHPFSPVTRAMIDAAPHLRVVSTVAVGYNNIDLGALRDRGIPLGHTPGVVVEATADITFGLILGVMRRMFSGDRYVRDGKWMGGMDALGNDLAGKTLGIFGMGAIGMSVARRARASNMKIAYSNRNRRDDAPDATYCSFDELLATADCLCILAPLSPETHHIINAAALAKMKPGAYLVNAARGGLVDTQALHDALASGRLAGAAVDVLDPEPIGADHPLLTLPTFSITPHIGTGSVETRMAMARMCIANAVAGLRGEPLLAAVAL